MIINNWQGKNWKLVHKDTGQLVNYGQALFTFNGHLVYFRTGSPPNKPGSTGRIFVVYNADNTDPHAYTDYFPGVCGLEWVEVPIGEDSLPGDD